MLHLDENALEDVPDACGNLTSLTHLTLAGNRLFVLPASIARMSSLLHLTLAGNPLIGLQQVILQLQRQLPHLRLDVAETIQCTQVPSIDSLYNQPDGSHAGMIIQGNNDVDAGQALEPAAAGCNSASAVAAIIAALQNSGSPSLAAIADAGAAATSADTDGTAGSSAAVNASGGSFLRGVRPAAVPLPPHTMSPAAWMKLPAGYAAAGLRLYTLRQSGGTADDDATQVEEAAPPPGVSSQQPGQAGLDPRLPIPNFIWQRLRAANSGNMFSSAASEAAGSSSGATGLVCPGAPRRVYGAVGAVGSRNAGDTWPTYIDLPPGRNAATALQKGRRPWSDNSAGMSEDALKAAIVIEGLPEDAASVPAALGAAGAAGSSMTASGTSTHVGSCPNAVPASVVGWVADVQGSDQAADLALGPDALASNQRHAAELTVADWCDDVEQACGANLSGSSREASDNDGSSSTSDVIVAPAGGLEQYITPLRLG